MKKLLAACAAALVILTSDVSAWSSPGHMIVTAIAYDQLAEAERLKMDAILRGHTKYATWKKTFPEAGIPGLPLEKFIAMLASLYPDDIRNQDNPETFAEWHYIDYPLIPPDFPMRPSPSPGDDILTGIEKSSKAVRRLTSTFDIRTRAKMLSYLLHLVGDIHQPMHCETLFNKDFPEPEGDRGGNKAWVKPPGGTAIKLHAFWDQRFGSSGQLFRPVPVTMIIASRNRAEEIARRLPRSAFSNLTEHRTPVSWSLEGRALAISDGWRRAKLPYGLTEATAAELPADYEEKATAVAERQVAIAGHRLADELNSALKP